MKRDVRSETARRALGELDALWDCIAKMLAQRLVQDQRSLDALRHSSAKGMAPMTGAVEPLQIEELGNE